MAVIHVTEAEAGRDLSELIAKVRQGTEVVIERENEPLAVLRSPDGNPPRRSISEAIRLAEERGSPATLDDAFGDDMEEIMRFNRQERPDPWESF